MSERPDPSEYPPFYGGYVRRVPDGPLLDRMREQLVELPPTLRALDESSGDDRYAPGKWSVREVLAHVADTEQVMGFRALHFARCDAQPLPGFSQDDWAARAAVNTDPLARLADRFEALRRAHLHLFESLDSEALLRRGTASGGVFTVRSLGWILVGHAWHHMDVLRERYGA